VKPQLLELPSHRRITAAEVGRTERPSVRMLEAMCSANDRLAGGEPAVVAEVEPSGLPEAILLQEGVSAERVMFGERLEDSRPISQI
jgi:hypothetical protein